jgi:hypothetical protein
LILQRDLKDADFAASLLEGFAQTPAANAKPDRAIQLIGAAAAYRERIDLALMQIERAEYDRLIATLREQIDAPTYQLLWDAGRALTIEQAIELALSESNE